MQIFFYKLKLIIEVDGPIHNNEYVKQNDIERQKAIESEGIKVVRFTNEEVIKRLETVIEKIETLLHE